MNAPVTPAAPAVRTAPTSGAAQRSSAGPSPFASMLDDALSVDRGPADRGIERRSTPDERDSRAADRAAAKADRSADRAAERADRATHRAERASAHAAHRPDRTADRASETAEVTEAGGTAVDGDTPVDAEATETTETSTLGNDTDRTALPAAVWALLMGGVVPVRDAPEAITTDAATVIAAVPAASTADPAALPVATTPGTGTVALDSAPDGTPATTAPVAATPAQQAAEAGLAGFTVVRAEVPSATTPASGLPGATATAAMTTAPVVAASAAPAAAPTTAPTAQPPGDTAAEVAGPATTPAAVAGAAPAAVGDTGTRDSGASASPPTAAPAGGVPAGEAQSSGAGNSSQQGPADGGDTPSTAPVLPSGSPAPAVPVVGPAGAAEGATGDSAAQPVGTQVARQVAVLRGGPDGAHTMTLVLTPDTLGPVEVQVTLQKGTVDLTLRGAHEQGRAALLDALPDLRRDLEAAGLSCSSLEVDRDSGGSWLDRHSAQQHAAAQQQTFGDRSGQPTPGDTRSRPWQRTADSSDDRTVPTSQRSTSSGVDVRV